MTVPSTKPYLVRAIYEWCVDNGFTPYVAVVVDEHTRVPAAYVRDGQIVLNIAPHATHNLQMGNEDISFQARFNGVAHQLYVPIDNVAAIYARENGQGMGFAVGNEDEGDLEDDTDEGEEATEAGNGLIETQLNPPLTPEGHNDDEPPRPGGGRGHLRVIK